MMADPEPCEATKRKGPRWKERSLIREIPLDKPGWTLRVHRLRWPDDSECFQLSKYVNGTMYQPPQYVQSPIALGDWFDPAEIARLRAEVDDLRTCFNTEQGLVKQGEDLRLQAVKERDEARADALDMAVALRSARVALKNCP
jgi:hypothetical protein